MPIQFIDDNKLESCRMGLTNHTQPIISHHITPLVINDLGGGHTNTHTNTRMKTVSRFLFRTLGLNEHYWCVLNLKEIEAQKG